MPLFLFSFIEKPFCCSWLWFSIPLFFPVPSNLPSNSVKFYFCHSLENKNFSKNNNKIQKDKTKTITSEMDKINKQKGEWPGGETWIRGLIIHSLRYPIKTLNWKPQYTTRGPGADLYRPCACCLILSEYIWAFFMLIRLSCSCPQSPHSFSLFYSVSWT